MIFLDLVFNLSFLVALSLVSSFIENRRTKHHRLRLVLQGLLFGAAAVLAMLRPLNLGPGLIFDGRSIMVSLCALFFGPLAAATAGALTILCRIWLGGAGMLTGVLVILSSAGIGLLAHSRCKPESTPPSPESLYLFGLTVHLAMVALMFTLPEGKGLTVVMRIGPPVMLLYPLATILAGKILSDQMEARRVMAALQTAEVAARAGEERYKHLSANIPVGVYLLRTTPTTEFSFEYVSPKMGVFLGIPPERIIMDPQLAFQAIHPEELPAFITLNRERIEARQPFAWEGRVIVAKGVKWLQIKSEPEELENGDVLWHGIVENITKRKQAEEMLHLSEAQLKANLENTPTVAIQWYDETGRVLYWNPASEKVYGWKKEEALGKTLDALFLTPEETAEFLGILEEIHETGKPIGPYEAQIKRRDGSHGWILATTFGIPMGEGRPGFVSMDVDITDRKEAEAAQQHLQEQLLQSQKMESVGRLAGGVAHDFNNMLSVIMGNAELAMQQANPAQPHHACLMEIHQAGARAANLTRQLLTFARKQTVVPKVLDLNDTVEGMLKMLRRLIGEDIDLIWRPDTGLWPVKMDPSQVDQILANLCVNARDAIAGVGKLTITTENSVLNDSYSTALPDLSPGEYVLLTVTDTGCGIEQDTLQHIFEPFFTSKGLGQGTGLGLATVYGIVTQNSGLITASSVPGSGATFTIYLPRHTGAVELESAATATIPHGHGETILLVEDDPKILTMAKMLTEMLDYTVLAANTPDEAIRLAEEHPGVIHLLMTDVIMPEMNGRDLAEHLRPTRPTMQCLFMSGYTADIIGRQGVLSEGTRFLQKPFSKMELAIKLSAVLHPKSNRAAPTTEGAAL